MKKVPLRKCLVSNTIYPKMELFRVVRTPENQVILDITGKANGRGAYIHKDIDSIEKARKSKVLNKNLGIEVPNEIYDRMYHFLDV
ncbi:MAG: YlxR family protein [Firmicutes bacterium]|uniref:YlxR family protein n=1 Tax=Candidatus Onthovivens merdipullorum TaxID=2840889 RepID=A0A9D9GWR9_9BACL|nr:YlxR family protein [Candidatus Onthovivens merdipullorum]